MVGTFKRQKGHMFLVEAIPQVCERHPGLHVLLVGDGELRGAMEQQVAEAGIAEHVTFLGTRGDIPELLAASDSFVLPSLWEGLPVALVEAMASGLPVIATTVSGTNEVVVDGESGFLVPPGDPSRLADAMCRLLCDPGTAAAIAAAGQARVAARFSARTQAETLSTLFRGRAADLGRVRSSAGRRPWAATRRS
jgi:glycosyltransferase involved in cell wall biosynthesis